MWKTYGCIGFLKPYCCFSSVAIWHIVNARVPLPYAGAFQFLKFLHNGGLLLAYFFKSSYLASMVSPKNKLKQQNFMHGKAIMGGCY